MEKEYWCCALVIMPNEKATIKEAEEVMSKIESWLGRDWDRTPKETIERRKNFIDIHDWDEEKADNELQSMLENTNFTYRYTDETLGGCETCLEMFEQEGRNT